MDKANHRSSHKGVVPKGGGIGILAAFLLASWMLGLSYSLNDFMVLCAFLFPFYADELTTLYVRIKGERHSRLMDRLMKPHR
ncbi:hypothetical protein, partial [Desulfobacula sp.]|uniref:hypothetical protein n=1 Tax=Desulfobacula sp. TaxID=2593537 RepID=UPI00260EB3B2